MINESAPPLSPRNYVVENQRLRSTCDGVKRPARQRAKKYENLHKGWLGP